MEWSVGQRVFSKQGRDRGKQYVIIEIEAKCCYVADGRKVTAAQPKKKNFKHLQPTLVCSTTLCEKINKREKITDEELREFLSHTWPGDGTKEE